MPQFLSKVSVCRIKHTVNEMENEIKELDSVDGYKFLGVEENQNVDHKNVREKLKREYVRRQRLILTQMKWKELNSDSTRANI